MITFTKSTIAFSVVLLLPVLLTFQSCKKKTIVPAPINLVCDGHPDNTFMPLKEGNKWGVTSTNLYLGHTLEISGTKTMGGKSYFETHYTAQTEDYYIYYRMDANGDIYKYNATDNTEYLEIPNNPTDGQVVATYHSGEYLKVSSTNASYHTSKCYYVGLLKIELYSMGSVTTTFYYKKGLGEVAETNNFGYMGLDNVTLN